MKETKFVYNKNSNCLVGFAFFFLLFCNLFWFLFAVAQLLFSNAILISEIFVHLIALTNDLEAGLHSSDICVVGEE